MKGKIRPVLRCTVSAVAVSMVASMTTMAAPSDTDIENSKWAYRAVADVNTQVNIRANASTGSAIVGYLPKAAAADVIERGPEWSHIISNGVEGYIKNEYLAYGADAKYLASVYGKQGVEVSWDGVNVFSQPDGSSKIVKKADGGNEFEILNAEGHWYSVQMNDGNVAYVPSEDVQETIILDKAIPVETASANSAVTWTDNSGSGAAESYTEPQTSPETEAQNEWVPEETAETAAPESEADTYQEPEYVPEETAAPEAEAPQTEAPQTEAPQTEAPQTEAPQTEAPQTEAPQTEAPVAETTEPTEETVVSASTDDVSLLAALIFCEAGNQPREGKVAVGAVVMNRIASGSYPGTISDVIYQSGQFAPAITGWLGEVIASGAPQDCLEAAQAALNGENPVPGALYFNNSAGKGTQIGDHYFY